MDLTALDEWLVALDIDDDIGIGTYLLSSFLDAVGTALMVAAGHDGTPSKLFHTLPYALVVSGDIGLSQHGDGLFIDALDDGFATQQGKWLARKACRGKAGGNNGYKLHAVVKFFLIWLQR